MNLYEQQIEAIIKKQLPWDNLNGKTLLLSGATGMIGKCIIDILSAYNESLAGEQQVKVIAISRTESKARKRLEKYWNREWFHYFACDVNENIAECGQADYVIHAASNTHPKQYSNDAIGTITSNVIGTKNLLDYAVNHGTQRFCFVSSVEIYGENRGDVDKFDEGYLGIIDCNTLRSGYPESKRVGESLCNAYMQTYGLDFVIPRLSRVYGPTMLKDDTKAISQFIKKALAGENIVLKSEGTQKYSYTFVTDAAAAIIYIILLGNSGNAYNISDSESDITLRDLAEYLAELSSTSVVFELPKESERRGYSAATKAMLDSKKLESLGWTAQVHIKAGLKSMVKGDEKE